MKKLLEQILENIDGTHKYSSTQVQAPQDIAEKVLKYSLSIPDEDLYTEEEGHGRELDIHVTIFYGLITSEVSDVNEAIKKYSKKDISVEFGNISLFDSNENGNDYDVLKIDIISKDLKELHELLDQLDNKNKYPDYKPHCTIAYVKKGLGSKYTKNNELTGSKFSVNSFIFSTAEGNKLKINL